MAVRLNFGNLGKIFPDQESAPEAKVREKYEQWVQSDFAGFRNILDPCAPEHPDLEAIKKFAEERSKGATGKTIRNFVVLGTGGSSLGAETLIRALRFEYGEPRFFFMDNNDPAWFAEHLQFWQAEETLFYVVSKSGGTAETWSQLLTVLPWLQQKLPENAWKQHLVCCSDPERGDLREFARKNELLCLDVPSSVGGRFSVFTAVGLFPAAFAGIDIERLLKGSEELVELWEAGPLQENPVYQLAQVFHRHPERNVSVLFAYSSHLRAFGRWFAQLWAESLGKGGKGFTPFPAIGTTDQHSQVQLYMEGPQDKIVGFIHVNTPAEQLPLNVPKEAQDLKSVALLQDKSMHDLFDAEFRATRDAFEEQGIPYFTIELNTLSEESIGGLLYFWEWVTVLTGALMEINPFDQPGVEKAKLLTKEYLSENS